MNNKQLVVIETHPIQYHAPVYRVLQQDLHLPVTVIYGSDFSVAGYRDEEFGTTFAWDGNLLAGYSSLFLTREPGGGEPSVSRISARGLGTVLKEIAPDAVLLVGYGFRFHQAAFWHARQLGCPLLFRAETTDHAQVRHPLKQWGRDMILRWFYQHFSGLLFIGQRSLAHYQRLLKNGESRLFFSPYGVDVTPFQTTEQARDQLRRSTRKGLGISEDQFVILFSGKFVPKKAPELLIQALKRLPPEERDRKVILFMGDGPLRERLAQLAGETPSVQLQFLGFQNQKALSPFYHAADLFVLPSQFGETWGLVVNEALHHGVPCVVSSHVGCAADLIVPGETGEIFQAGDAGQLLQAISRAGQLVGQPEVRDRCRQQVSHYTITQAAHGIATAFAHATRTYSVPALNS